MTPIPAHIEREKEVVSQMIALYCRRKEGNQELCDDCKALLRYAHTRLEQCRYEAHKGSCKECQTHCYKPDMREQIRRVMRFSGPRMLLCAPLTALRHLMDGLR